MNNCLIRASAGTGKTFALATRIIRLLLLGAEPNHIVALTFSRAAAGEIFNRIAGRLAEAARDDGRAAAESGHLYDGLDASAALVLRARAGEPVPRAAFAALLRRLIATQHASMIGTIDSFMTRMVQAFPLELGLQGALSIMDDYRVEREKSAAISSLLSRAAAGPEAELFFEAFRQATFGREGKSYSEKLASFVDTWHAILQDHPAAQAWGRPEAIWPGGEPFAIHGATRDLSDRLAAELRPRWAAEGREKAWDEFCSFVRAFNGTFPAKAAVKNALDAYDPSASTIEISYNRRAVCFAGGEARLIRETVETLYALVLRARCQSTQGLYRLMQQLEAAYARSTRQRGLLTFDDVPRLIARLDASVRQNIEYRFDSRFSHWALDEFQDTSRAQWSAIRNLVDEVIQSADDARSLFVVGDMKQAIYGWRGGDVAIFEREAESGHYALADLSTTYRYCPQIANLVNRVFDGARVDARVSPEARGAGARWRRLWQPHTSLQRGGFVSAERVEEPDKEAGEKAIDPYLQAACRHLLALRPWERGLSAAVLVRTNDHGRSFAEALRRAGAPAVWEGESAICDTPAVTALLHLLRVAEHPGDTLAWRHVCASPLGRVVFADACGLPDDAGVAALSRRVLDDVSRLGLPRALRGYLSALSGESADAFTRLRFDELLRAATRFAEEADAQATLTDFAAYAESFKTRDVADTSTVKILTIHRSKGLGFDIVLLPVIESGSFVASRADDVLFAPDDSWLLINPGRQVIDADATLSAARAHTTDDAVFESLCVQYVAMTRAKRALVVLLRPPASESSSGVYFSDHIAESIGEPLPWSAGDGRWFEQAGDREEAPAQEAEPAAVARPPRRAVRRVTPSSAVCYGRAASELFSARDDEARQRGTRLHEALSRIVWLAPGAAQPDGVPSAELDLASASAFRDALARPPDATDLWRECDFELLADGEWISGTFDRVVFRDGPEGRSAEVYDFKTNRRREGESDAAFARRMCETYEGQMNGYRRALARLASLPELSVRCTLLLTATRQAVRV
jgi:ATP-dependent helicase/nuclease subunit A